MGRLHRKGPVERSSSSRRARLCRRLRHVANASRGIRRKGNNSCSLGSSFRLPKGRSPPGVLPAVWCRLLDDLDRDQAGWLARSTLRLPPAAAISSVSAWKSEHHNASASGRAQCRDGPRAAGRSRSHAPAAVDPRALRHHLAGARPVLQQLIALVANGRDDRAPVLVHVGDHDHAVAEAVGRCSSQHLAVASKSLVPIRISRLR